MMYFLWFGLGWISALLVVCMAAGLFTPLPRRLGFDVDAEGRRLHDQLAGRLKGRGHV
jgi:hypothetical protein